MIRVREVECFVRWWQQDISQSLGIATPDFTKYLPLLPSLQEPLWNFRRHSIPPLILVESHELCAPVVQLVPVEYASDVGPAVSKPLKRSLIVSEVC
jgi:hypothetical protein